VTIKRPTQADVADLANVSRATVSYVINGLANSQIPISQDTIERVWSAVETLGYEPHVQAQSLRTGGSTKTIGILIPDVRNPHYWEMIEGFESEAHELGYHVMMFSSALSGERSINILKALAGRRIDGIILVGSYVTYSDEAQAILRQMLEQRLPIVLGNLSYQTDCLHSDYRQATFDLLDYLYKLGHRRFGLLYGVAPDEEALDRLEPFKEFLIEKNLARDRNAIIRCGPTIAEGFAGAMQMLQKPHRPSAVLCVNDWLAVGALRAASTLGLKVPDELSIAGFDAIILGEYCTPSITTVSWDTIRWSREAVKLVVRRLENPDSEFRKVVVPHKLVVRESTGPAAVGRERD